MPVIGPTSRRKVDLDASRAKFAFVEEDYGALEVRAQAVTPGASMHDLQALTIDCRQGAVNITRVPRRANRDLWSALRHDRELPIVGLDFERFALDRRQARFPALPILAKLLDGRLQRAQRQRGTAHPAAHDLVAHLIGHRFKSEFHDFVKR